MKKKLVIDCSVTIAWCLLEEGSLYAEQVLQKVFSSYAMVPSIWPYAVANVLNFAKRKKRINDKHVEQFRNLIVKLPIHIEQTDHNRILEDVLELAKIHGLSVYDAAYLELTKREQAIFATLDKALQTEALKEGVTLAV